MANNRTVPKLNNKLVARAASVPCGSDMKIFEAFGKWSTLTIHTITPVKQFGRARRNIDYATSSINALKKMMATKERLPSAAIELLH
ncbi:MAG: hypothetical protein ACOYW3_11410 [Bacteroidota bacterium]